LLFRIYELAKHVIQKPSVITNAYKVLKKQGFLAVFLKIKKVFYANRYLYIEPEKTEDIKKRLHSFSSQPLISIIMPVYNVDPKWLQLAIDSVQSQWYENWELCITDDASTNKKTLEFLRTLKHSKIKIAFFDTNVNISAASNQAIKLAEGEYIALLDNDDELSVDALYEVVKNINETQADFIYSDEDFITTKGLHVNPHYKPDFSPDLLLSHNYITHLCTIKKSLLDEVGYFRSECDGAQDYDLFLRVTEKAKKILHIPKVLYHWRMLPTSTSSNVHVKPQALLNGIKALEYTLKRRKIDAEVFEGNLPHYFRIKRKIKGNPLVSIVIPFKDKPELLKMCIGSILEKSTYKNFEIIGMSNNSEESETFATMKMFEKKDSRVHFYEHNEPFNYSEINNHAVKNYAKGEHIVLLNNDIEIITSSWIEALLEHSQREEVGCVGAKLYYPDEKIQHAGVILGLGGYAAHSHRLSNGTDYGYFNRLNIIQNLSAVTGACLMIKKSIYQAVGGLDEEHFKIAYNDVDFCLRVREKGYLNIFTPYCEAYHYESISRGDDREEEEKNARFDEEKAYLKLRHPKILEDGDPYYNQNLSLDFEDFRLKIRA